MVREGVQGSAEKVWVAKDSLASVLRLENRFHCSHFP